MPKRLSAVTGEYQDKQTNQQKAEWTNLGVILTNNNGKEYMLLDPSISLSGVLAKQNALAIKKGEQIRDNIMVIINEDQQSNNQQPSNQGYQQPNYQQAQSGFSQQSQQQNSPQQPQQNYQRNQNQSQSFGQQAQSAPDFDDD